MIGANGLLPHKFADDSRLYWLRYRRAAGPGHAQVAPVLARHLDCAPAEIAFGIGAGGRPYLARPVCDVDFNVSHSGERLLLAIGCGRFGVDVESLARPRDFLALARHQFGPDEILGLEAAPEAERGKVFLELWTAKEALLKALGRGLAGMREVRLTRRVDGALSPATLPREAGDPSSWRLRSFSPEPGYRATVAWQVV